MNSLQNPGPPVLPVEAAFEPRREESRTTLMDWLWLAWRNKWSILGIALVALILSLLYAYTRVPVYRATASLLFEARPASPVQFQQSYDPGFESLEYFGTQVEVVRSRVLASMVVDKLDLTSHPVYAAEPASRGFWSWLPFLPDEPVAAVPDDEQARKVRHENVVSSVMGQVQVETVPRTQLMRISFLSTSPELAMVVANAYSDAYVEYGLDARLNATEKASAWMNGKLGDIKKKLEASEQALQAYRDKQQLVNVGDVRKLMDDELLDNSRRLRETQKTKTDLATTYWKVQQAGNDVARLEEISDLLRLPLVQTAKSGVVSAQEALAQLQQRYGEKHPQIASAKTRLETAQKTFQEQLKLAAQNIRTEYEIAKENERQLTDVVSGGKSQIQQLDRKDYEYRVLQRDVDTNRQLYDMFLTRFKENDTTGSYAAINARPIDPAILPSGPYTPNKMRIARTGLFLGLLLGVALVVFRHQLEETVRSAQELEALTGLPVLGVVPILSDSKQTGLAREFAHQPRTPYGEAIRSTRTGLQLTDIEHRYKCIMVASAVPGEGKSSISASLATAFGATGKTLLLEADLRAPSQAKALGITPQQGLLELLLGDTTLDKALFFSEACGIHVLPVVQKPANPGEVVNSKAFLNLLETLRGQFDRIIIDTPPINAAGDSLMIARLSDTVLFVVRSDKTKRRTVTTAIKQLRQIQAHIVGSVVNQANPRSNPNYRDAYYYTRGYYG